MTLPVYLGAGAAVAGTGNVMPSLPSGWVLDDIFLLATENSETSSPATPSGWTPLGASQQGSLASTRSRLTLWWRRATASETDPVTVLDPGDHALAQIFAFRGCDKTNPPVLGTFGGNVLDSTYSAPAVTTTMADCLIAILGSASSDTATPQFGAFANAGLANIVMRSNIAVTDGNGGGLALATGEKLAAGSTGATTANLAASQSYVGVHIVFLPVPGVAGTAAITEAPDIGAAAATLGSHGAASLAEAADALGSASSLALAAALAAVEGTDSLLAAGAVQIEAAADIAEQGDAVAAQTRLRVAGTLYAGEDGDGVSASGFLPLKAMAAPVEVDDALLAETFMGSVPLPFRKGGGEDRKTRRRQLHWQRDLRRIIDEAWRIAEGEIDPDTREPVPPPEQPDFSQAEAALVLKGQAMDRLHAEAFIVRAQRRQEDEAVALLLLAA